MDRVFTVRVAWEHYGSSSLFLVTAFLVCVASFLLWFKNHRITKFMATLPGPPTYPIIGNLGGFLKVLWKEGNGGVINYCLDMIDKYSPKRKLIRMWLSYQPCVGLLSGDVAEPLLTSQEVLDKAFLYKFLQPWLRTGLLTSTGGKWRNRRKLLTPTFHFRILENFIPIFNEQSMVLVQKLQECAGTSVMDITPHITNCALDIICETAMGVQIGAQNNRCPEYVGAIQYLGHDIVNRALKPWLWSNTLSTILPQRRKYKECLDILHSFTKKVMRERKEALLMQKNSPDTEKDSKENVYLQVKKRRSFLDLLLHYHLSEQALSEDDISEEVDTFMFEGHDTTAIGMSWALYNIGLCPEVQKMVVAELNDIFGEDTQRPVNQEDLKAMKYLECVLKESQRMYPSVPIIGRTLHSDLYIPSEDVTIPKGVSVFLPVFYVHRNPCDFSDPDVFDPNRFLPENCAKRNPFSFIPFSAGPRNCIGQKFAMMEEKIVVANVLRHFTIKSLDRREDLTLVPELVLRSTTGIRIQLSPRQKS